MRRNGAPGPQQRFYSMDPTNQRPCSFYRSPKFLCWFIGPLFVLSLFAWGCYAFSYLLCIETLSKTSALGALYIIIFNGLMLMATISLLRTTFTDPGSVPKNFQDDVLLRERTPKGEMRYCKTCDNLKPDRAHHCSMAGACVLKMDHFCPWVGNTVGFRNYKYFMLFLFYTVLTCWAGCILSISNTIRLMSAEDIAGRDINQIVLTFVGGVFAIVLTIFSGQHVWLALNNLSTLESMDRGRLKKNVYDLGRSNNWRQVFGNDIKMWIVPVHTAIGDGIEWEINVDESLLAPVNRNRDEDVELEEGDSHSLLSDNIV